MSNLCEPAAEMSSTVFHADILYKLFKYFTYGELATSVVHVCQLWRHIARKRMLQLKLSRFTYEGLSPVTVLENGFYPPFHWQNQKWLRRWNVILQDEHSFETLPLPPLVLNEGIDDIVPIVLYGQRHGNDFWIIGGFHRNVPQMFLKCSPFNVQLELSFTFTKKDNTTFTVYKKIIATMENLPYDIHYPTLFSLYDVPFASLSSSTAPTVTNISMQKCSTEQNWWYGGLPPQLISGDGKFNTVAFSSLSGTFDSMRVWQAMVENREQASLGYFSFPPLLLPKEIAEDVVVCVIGRKVYSGLQFHARVHPSTPENSKSLHLQFKMKFYATKNDNTTFLRTGCNILQILPDYTGFVAFPSELFRLFTLRNLPWSTFSSSVCPRVKLAVLTATEEMVLKKSQSDRLGLPEAEDEDDEDYDDWHTYDDYNDWRESSEDEYGCYNDYGCHHGFSGDFDMYYGNAD